jgi:hypothetical protein
MNLQVTESQLKLIEQQQLNELSWLADIQAHINRLDIPLTPSFVNYIWGKQKVTTFHIGDVNGIDRMAEMIGTRKSLSTFRFMNKDLVTNMHGIRTEGGIIYQIVGDLQFDAPSDILSGPDYSGRRWVSSHVFPNNFMEEFNNSFQEYNNFNDITNPKDLINYYRWIDGLIRKYAKDIREHFTDIKENTKNRKSNWNETVVNNIQIKDILWKESIVDFLETWETMEQKINVIKEIGIKLNSIATGTVYLSDNEGMFSFGDVNPVKWVEKRGGLTDFKKYVKKFHVDKKPRTIQINEDKPNPNNPPFEKKIGGGILSTPDKPVDNTACVIFGGVSYATPKWMMGEIPQEIKDRKTILVLPFTSNLDEAKRILGKTPIKSVLGFSAGGIKAWPASGEYEFVGLIDPSTDKNSLRYHINDNRVHMIYNPSGWGPQYQKIIDSQKEAAKIMKGNATLLNIGHSKMPSEFFRRFGNNL